MSLQDLQRKIYVKAKAEPSGRFWGLYGHVCTRETRRAAYGMAKANNGAPGIDGVTVEAIEASGGEPFLEQRRDARVARTSQPMRVRRKASPQDGGTQVRVLGIPTIRDRGVPGALQLILAPVVEADFQPGSYGYRPTRSAHAAGERVAEAMVSWKPRVMEVDLQGYGDNIRHHVLVAKIAQRVNDADVMHRVKSLLTASGRQGVPQGGVLSPLLSQLSLTEVDRMLERAKAVTRNGTYTSIESARFADDMVI